MSQVRRPRLNSAVADSTTPIFMLKANRRLVSFNKGCEQLTGWKSSEVVGSLCTYSTEGSQSRSSPLTSSLCPPPQVFEGETLSVPAYIPNRKGQSLARTLHFFPLPEEDGELKYILGLIAPLASPTPATGPRSQAQHVHAELTALRISLRQRYRIENFIARTPVMKRVLEQFALAQNSASAVFLQGERGTGRQHLASLIHYSAKTPKAFVPLDCRAITRWELKESIQRLFNQLRQHDAATAGLMPGTLYLSNVQAISRDVQELVLEYWHKSTEPPLRLISSSETDLQTALDSEDLLPDFFYLLTPLRIQLPPLRSRRDDLLPLATHFLERSLPGEERRKVIGFSAEVLQLFQEYNWPGNIRELELVVSEARAACEQELIQRDHLPFRFRTGLDAQQLGPPSELLPLPLEEMLNAYEKEVILRALAQCQNNKSKAAALLGITRPRIYRRMESLGIADLEDKSSQ